MTLANILLHKGLILSSHSVEKEFNENTINALSVNTALLMKIINDNKNTEYGRIHKFKRIKSIADFKNNVPLNNYSDFEPFIIREAKGEKNILTKNDVEYFGHSSGTTGSQKLLPITKESRNIALKLNGILCQKFIYNSFVSKWTYGKGVMLVDMLQGNKSSGGINVTSASSGGMRKIRSLTNWVWTSPVEIMDIADKDAAFYLHVLFALKEKKLMYLAGLFISSILDFFRFIENNQHALINDLRSGKITEKINIDKKTRNILNRKLGRSVKRSNELESEFSKGFQGIAKRIWPNLLFIASVTGANFANYNDLVNKYTDNLPIFSIAYAATEGFIGVNPYCDKIQYIMVPDSCFFEFIEIDDVDKDNPPTHLMNDLKSSHSYEIVLTTINGLYRYRLGDIIKVVGYYNASPMIEFLYRKNQLLNMVSEKTTENHVKTALQNTFKKLKCSLIDYTTFPDNSITPGRYTFYLELENFTSCDGISLLESKLDKELQLTNPAYGRFRKAKRLNKIKIKLVKKGTFAKYKKSIQRNGVSSNQLKIPRVIYDKNLIEKL